MSESIDFSYRDEIAEHVQNFGTSSSVALLDPSCKIFRAPGVEGVIGYRIQFGNAVVLGDPVCSSENWEKLVDAFHRHCDEYRLKIVYAIPSQNFVSWSLHRYCHSMIEFGEELHVDPQNDPTVGAPARKLRNKLSHCVHDGVSVHEFFRDNQTIEKEMELVGENWLKQRKGPQVYLANIHLFKNPLGKRWFYAKKENKIVGSLLLNRLEARQGWVLNLCLTTQDAPAGTSELLVNEILNTLRAEECRFLSFGSIPGEDIGRIVGIGKFPEWCVRNSFRLLKRFYRIEGKKVYWSKFQPFSEPACIMFSKPKIQLKAVFAILRALNP